MNRTDRSSISRLLEQHGLLLLSDNTLPSVATLVAGEPIRGSWWAHPQSRAIFHASCRIANDADVIAVPLVRRKVTFVHRRLWPALLAVGAARDRWQMAGLPAAARALLKRVDAGGEVEASGPAARALDRRLLVVAREIHSERGAHAKILESWDRWAARKAVRPAGDAAAARRTLEDAAAALGPRTTLPWMGGEGR